MFSRRYYGFERLGGWGGWSVNASKDDACSLQGKPGAYLTVPKWDSKRLVFGTRYGEPRNTVGGFPAPLCPLTRA
jgi:hypothetical protein